MAEKIRLFHGSKNGIQGKIKPVSRELCDFGKGFYMGTEQEQPKTLICNYVNAAMYELELDTANLNIKDIALANEICRKYRREGKYFAGEGLRF